MPQADPRLLDLVIHVDSKEVATSKVFEDPDDREALIDIAKKYLQSRYSAVSMDVYDHGDKLHTVEVAVRNEGRD